MLIVMDLTRVCQNAVVVVVVVDISRGSITVPNDTSIITVPFRTPKRSNILICFNYVFTNQNLYINICLLRVSHTHTLCTVMPWAVQRRSKGKSLPDSSKFWPPDFIMCKRFNRVHVLQEERATKYTTTTNTGWTPNCMVPFHKIDYWEHSPLALQFSQHAVDTQTSLTKKCPRSLRTSCVLNNKMTLRTQILVSKLPEDLIWRVQWDCRITPASVEWSICLGLCFLACKLPSSKAVYYSYKKTFTQF